MSDYLHEDLIVEIFTRLPPKSLLRFRSLSKSLFSRISSPDFIRKHAVQSPHKILFLHSKREWGVQPFYTLHGEDELPLCLCPTRGHIGITTATFPRGSTFRTVGSSNGTFCLDSFKGLSLWNPSIRRKVSVPKCPRKFRLPLEGIGFGFDPISDDYKIVRIAYERDASFVYAVKTGAWCEIASPKPRFSQVADEGFLLNGVLHWQVYHCDIKCREIYGPSHILTFDLSTHVFGMIPLPGYPPDWITTGMTTIQDSLALISYHTNVDDTWIGVWRDDSWSVVFKFGTGDLPITGALQLQTQPNNNGDLLITTGEGLQVYNSTTGVRSRVVNFDDSSTLIGFRRCVETLHLLDMGETACETDQL